MFQALLPHPQEALHNTLGLFVFLKDRFIAPINMKNIHEGYRIVP
jgi:hypothetical protein